MRKILFRGKRADNGAWILGSLLKVSMKNVTSWIIFKPDFDFKGDGVKSLGHARVDPETVGQCTGLKDDHGKWVFEGDIIKSHTGRILAVAFGQHRDDEYESLANGWFVFDDEGALSFGEDWGGFEVIGNIHDNPELVKGE